MNTIKAITIFALYILVSSMEYTEQVETEQAVKNIKETRYYAYQGDME